MSDAAEHTEPPADDAPAAASPAADDGTAPDARPAPDGDVPATPRSRGGAGMALLWIWAAALTLLAADRVFDLGLFPSRLEREVAARVEELTAPGTDDARRAALREELVLEGDFAVPHLVDALGPADAPGQAEVRAALERITGSFAYESPPPEGWQPGPWRDWLDDNPEHFD